MLDLDDDDINADELVVVADEEVHVSAEEVDALEVVEASAEVGWGEEDGGACQELLG